MNIYVCLRGLVDTTDSVAGKIGEMMSAPPIPTQTVGLLPNSDLPVGLRRDIDKNVLVSRVPTGPEERLDRANSSETRRSRPKRRASRVGVSLAVPRDARHRTRRLVPGAANAARPASTGHAQLDERIGK